MEKATAVNTCLGVLKGRDCIYLDQVKQDALNNLTFTGDINGHLISQCRDEKDWFRYTLTFRQVLVYFACELDTYENLAETRHLNHSSFDLIEDEGIQAIVENVRQDMATNVYQILVENGLTQWNAGNQDTAMTYFQASLAIQPANPEAMYYVARLYQDAGDMENANAMFDRVVNEYPDSEYAGRSQNARGY